MSAVLNPLQKAVFARLIADAELMALVGADGVFDHRRSARAMPYLLLSKSEAKALAEGVEEHLLSFEAWSRATGRAEAQAIAACAARTLDGADLALDGGGLARLALRTSAARRKEGSGAVMVELGVKALVDRA
ncbi:DUF3168 domain-containing protein [Rhizobium sp. TRM95796]|uniref:DUF3168 domain-containing protein n=1 Tax=Rhizobium sp. TRM95796 TaxID=2979862 RepID=UPI0021E802C8|nr:DUF3168 domain-containing protein [Rhizobium sp. TRM95796]MCV3765618.1 DUF3168 domain-containing protein [Rhizobium sp. TRM95796]